MSHVVIYVSGLGDNNYTHIRRLMIGSWRLYGIRPLVYPMNWSDKQPFEPKLQALLRQIDELTQAGNTVSLVGESAGASAAINAYAVRQRVIHRVACICGKLQNAQTISPQILAMNPAFEESMAMLPASLASLNRKQLERIRSVHPLRDRSVPVADTVIVGAESYSIPSVGHTVSIALGDTIFSYALVSFLKRP